MPINKSMSHEDIVKELMDSYRANGKIGSHNIDSEEKALKIANAVAYKIKRGK